MLEQIYVTLNADWLFVVFFVNYNTRKLPQDVIVFPLLPFRMILYTSHDLLGSESSRKFKQHRSEISKIPRRKIN
jgi:hypothetical protein